MVLITQSESIDGQIVVSSLSLEKNKCTSATTFTLELKNVTVNASKVKGFFTHTKSDEPLTFTCSDIEISNTKVNCDFNIENPITQNDYYKLDTLEYSVNSSIAKVAYIQPKYYITYNSKYNPLLSIYPKPLKVNINETVKFFFTFQNTLDSIKNISFTNTNNSSDIKYCFEPTKDNILECFFDNNSFTNVSTYSLSYENECGMTEFLDEILKVNSSLVLIKPNLSAMLNSTCRRELDSFNITTAGGEEKTTSIFGTMISRDNNTFNFTCTNLIEKDKSANITCRPTSKISTGTYHINQINFTTNDDKTNIKEAFLSGDTDSEISINTDFVPFIGQPPTNIEIDYDKSNSFTLEFNSSINEEAIPTILLAYNNEEIPINCSFVNALANCTIEDPSLIVSDQRYQVAVLDVCGAKTKTNITIDTKNLLLGTVHFDKSEIECTDKLSNFNITISDHKINANNIEGTFIDDDYNELTFTCSEITKESEYLSCSSNTHSSDLPEGNYTLFNVNYKIQNTDKVLSAELTDTQSFFYYKSTYNKFIPGNNHNVTLNLSSDNSFNLSFTKKINTNKKITFKTPSGFSEILECVPNSSDNTILTCKNPDGNGKTLPQGTYTIHYENECKNIENPDFIVTVINETKPSAQFIVGDPSFSDTNECKSIESLKINPSFTISNVYSTVKLQDIIGIVKSTINDKVETIEFTCGDIISGTLTCSFKGDNFNPGRYTLEFVQGIYNQEPIDAHLKNKITFMDLANTIVPFTPKNEKQFITSNNQKVNITFDSELSSKVYCVFIETNTNKEEFPECDISHTNKKILECDVSKLLSNSYNIYYINECTVRINTGITIYINKAMAMIFDSPVFPSSSCTNTIDTFTINYIGEYIYNTGLTIYLTHTNNI